MSIVSATAQILIHRPPDVVFETFADPSKLTQFWFPSVSGRLDVVGSQRWALGAEKDAFSFEVIVDEVRESASVQLRWGGAGALTTVNMTFVEAGIGHTHLRIEETGFGGDERTQVQAALESTKGFNQLVVAAKAFVEHGVVLNIVADHVE